MNRLDHYSETKCPTVSNMGSGFIVPRVQTVSRYIANRVHIALIPIPILADVTYISTLLKTPRSGKPKKESGCSVRHHICPTSQHIYIYVYMPPCTVAPNLGAKASNVFLS